MNYGADIDQVDANGQNIGYYLPYTDGSMDEIITFLFSVGFEGWAGLERQDIFYLIKHCSFDNAALIFKYAAVADILAQCSSGLLHGLRNLHVISFLIQHGMDVNEKGYRGITPLHMVLTCLAFKGQQRTQRSTDSRLEVVQHLLSHGAKANTRDEMGYTALMLAAEDGLVEVCNLLIDHGADLHAYDQLDFTPLHHAAKASWSESYIITFQTLLHRGADPHVSAIYRFKDCSMTLSAVEVFSWTHFEFDHVNRFDSILLEACVDDEQYVWFDAVEYDSKEYWYGTSLWFPYTVEPSPIRQCIGESE